MLRPTRTRDRRDQRKESPDDSFDVLPVPRELVRLLELLRRHWRWANRR